MATAWSVLSTDCWKKSSPNGRRAFIVGSATIPAGAGTDQRAYWKTQGRSHSGNAGDRFDRLRRRLACAFLYVGWRARRRVGGWWLRSSCGGATSTT